MKRILALGVAVSLFLLAAPQVQSQNNQLLQGTQLRLVLLNGLTTSVAREGDPFIATVTEPVYIGGQLLLPAGARVNGEVSQITRAKRFGILRGQAAMYLKFKSIEIDRREFPVPMSIISIHETSVNGRVRKDVRTVEGVIVESKRDVKGTLVNVAIGGGGGTAVGTIFSHAMRGLAIGLIGSTSYVMIKKGKEVELPAQTGILVRLDATITLPATGPSVSPYSGSQP